jgi:hypothetical protein
MKITCGGCSVSFGKQVNRSIGEEGKKLSKNSMKKIRKQPENA